MTDGFSLINAATLGTSALWPWGRTFACWSRSSWLSRVWFLVSTLARFVNNYKQCYNSGHLSPLASLVGQSASSHPRQRPAVFCFSPCPAPEISPVTCTKYAVPGRRFNVSKPMTQWQLIEKGVRTFLCLPLSCAQSHPSPPSQCVCAAERGVCVWGGGIRGTFVRDRACVPCCCNTTPPLPLPPPPKRVKRRDCRKRGISYKRTLVLSAPFHSYEGVTILRCVAGPSSF